MNEHKRLLALKNNTKNTLFNEIFVIVIASTY